MNPKKHWPSMFKSKSATSTGNRLHGTSTFSAMGLPYSEGDVSSPNYEREKERSPPKSKPRWNPKPEQIRILENIFNSGMVSPPREELKRIRTQLEEFGQVGEASVFYWFQNRKSKTKRRQRQLQAAQRSKSGTETGTLSSSSSTSTTTTSSSVQSKPVTDLASSPVNSMHNNIENQLPSSSAMPVSSFAGHQYYMQVNEEMSTNQYSNVQAIGAAATAGDPKKFNAVTGGVQDESIINANPLITVFINGIPTEVPMGPINYRAFFGDNSFLIHSSGKSVLVNEWGYISEGLEHEATYFLM